MKDILLVGCGKMGGALLRQWVHLDGFTFSVVKPSPANVPKQATYFESAEKLGETKFDVILIAIKPQKIDEVMPAFASVLAEGGCVISIAAGYAMNSLQSIWGGHAILRMMPNLPALIGNGMSGLVADERATPEQLDLLERLGNQVGQTIWLKNEDMLDRLTAVSGSGPGYVFEFARVYVEAAEGLGFSPEEARALVLATIEGTAQMALGSTEALAELRNSVTSKKGTTEAGLKALNADGTMTQRLQQTLQAAYQRAVELR